MNETKSKKELPFTSSLSTGTGLKSNKRDRFKKHKGTLPHSYFSFSGILFLVCIVLCTVFVYLGTQNDVDIYIDGNLEKQVITTSRTVAELFAELDMELHDKDRINLSADTYLGRNTEIFIERAFPVFISADNSVTEIWTPPLTAGELLESENISLGPYDEVNIDLNEKLQAHADIKIVRIEKIFTAMETSIPYESVYRDNPSLDRGMFRVVTEGAEGVKKETVEIVIADGEEVSREVVDEQVIEPPRDEIIENGTREIVSVAEINTEQNAAVTDINFQRSLNVNATAYCICPICTGTGNGITATGAPAIAGNGSPSNPHIIAVDPGVIPLHSTVYIDGYGYAVALDTGGAIRGNKIDLLFATHQEALRFGRRNLKVHVVD